jgi:hypothetical protein
MGWLSELLGGKKANGPLPECPDCAWAPEDDARWQCNCGYRWNTFTTRARCPACGMQHEKTRCIGCGSLTDHEDWYRTEEQRTALRELSDPLLLQRKLQLEARLIDYGIRNYRVRSLDYLDFRDETFRRPREIGQRLLVLYSLYHLAHEPDDRMELVRWLQAEGLWEAVSDRERAFLRDHKASEEDRARMSWSIEGALVLGWCVEIVDRLPRLDQDPEKALQHLVDNIPDPGDDTSAFLQGLRLHDPAAIYEENLLNELATTYFRDLLFNGQEDETQIDRGVSFERHRALNWVRGHLGQAGWDEVDTST